MHTHGSRICPNCDGFPIVAITTGTRHADGTRHVVPALCPACHGTGHAPRWLVTTRPTTVKAGAPC